MLRDRRPITPNTDIGGDLGRFVVAAPLLDDIWTRVRSCGPKWCLVGPGGYLRDREGPLVLRPIFCRHLGGVSEFYHVLPIDVRIGNGSKVPSQPA